MSKIHTADAAATPFDVLIIGSGISGINAAYHLQTELPRCRFAILEARDNIGGTWDLFRYPGIRSDSDLYTFGFTWHKWNRSNPIAEGGDILEYLDDAITNHRLKDRILFNHRVLSLEWNQHSWAVKVQTKEKNLHFSTCFLIFATGYYDYQQPLTTEIPGLENFQGQVIHPQFWPEDFDYTNKKITVIGSGATAITLVPKLAERAESVTMLQRSPTYIVAVPNPVQNKWWARLLPQSCMYYLRRIWRLVSSQVLFRLCRTFPQTARSLLERGMLKHLPLGVPLNPHFKPRYNPWEQRLCVCPDGDFFKALGSRKATVETETIKTVDEQGIQLTSGRRLEADLIVTATGLKLQVCGGIPIYIDGKRLDLSQKYAWNGLMMQDLPNAVLMLGYVNASWTLGADAGMYLTCKVLKYLERNGHKAAVPVLSKLGQMNSRPLLDLKSTYLTRAQGSLPKATEQRPWVSRTNYFSDMYFARYGDLSAGLEFI